MKLSVVLAAIGGVGVGACGMSILVGVPRPDLPYYVASAWIGLFGGLITIIAALREPERRKAPPKWPWHNS